MWLILEHRDRPGSCCVALPLREGTSVVGRGAECDVVLLGRRISRRHLVLERRGAHVTFCEAADAVGAALNGAERERGDLKPGDRLELDHNVLRVEPEPPKAEPEAAAGPTAGPTAALPAGVGQPPAESVEVWQPFQAFLETLRQTVDPRVLLNRLLTGLVDIFKADRGYVLLQERAGAKLVPVASHHLPDTAAFVEVSSTVALRALEGKAIVSVANTFQDVGLRGARSIADAPEPRTILCGPLTAEGQTFGVIYLDMPLAPGAASPSRLRLFETVTGLASQLVAAGQTRRNLLQVRGRAEALNALVFEGEQLILGSSPASLRLNELVATAASQDVTVLVTGETGTGKEMVARAVHRMSSRRDGPFVPVNCAALPADIIEAELFGAEKGAFTGATERRLGRFELASGGTLFLDEVGELPLDFQVKLLRVLQERTVTRLGSNELIPLDLRLVCATNADVEAAVRDGRLRRDIYYRINVFRVELAPLRQRREDILPLATHFLGQYAKRFQRHLQGFSPEAERLLLAAPWPGNVRELRNAVERAALVERSSSVQPASLPIAGSIDAGVSSAGAGAGTGAGAGGPPGFEGWPDDFERAAEVFERGFFVALLERYRGNAAAAAKAANMPRSSFYRHLGKLGLVKGA